MVLHKTFALRSIIKRVKLRAGLYRCYGSALYVTGNRGTDTCLQVTPHVDFNDCLNNIDLMKETVRRRKSETDVDRLRQQIEFFLTFDKMKKLLEARRKLISETIEELASSGKTEEIEKLTMHARIVREDSKHLRHALWPIEEKTMLRILSLPNLLHKLTPDSKTVVQSFGKYYEIENPRSHIDIGREKDLLLFTNPYNYYLMNDAAIFELKLKFFFSECLRKLNYIQFSNPDFTKSVVVDGCGLNHKNPGEVFILHHSEDSKVDDDNRLHLTGGGSLLAFMAYYTRHIVLFNAFPLRHYCFGRQYKPIPETSTLGLFEVCQSTVVEIFIATDECDKALNDELNQVTSDISAIYEKLGYPFRVCYLPAEELASWESMRVSFEMYSMFYKKYIEVGYISVSDSYISKRLQFQYYKKRNQHFPKIISGTVLNIPKILGCVLERNPDSPFVIPEVICNAF